MRFDLVQSISLAGDPAIPNDDRAGAGDRLAWVIDGATDLGPPGLVGPRGGAAWLAQEADAALSTAADAPLAQVSADLVARLARRFEAVRTRDPLDRWELPIAALMLARLGEGRLDYGWFADCVGILAGPAGVRRLGRPGSGKDDEAAHAASVAAFGLGSVKGREGPLIESLRASRQRPNRAVLGVEGDIALFETGSAPCAPGDTLLLMSDGFAALVDSYGVYDEAGLAAAVAARGLAALAVELRRIEAEDAACTRFARFKTSDDATALLLRIA